MDLVHGVKRGVVLMEHVAKDGGFKLLEQCWRPLTRRGVVERVITGLAVVDVSEAGLRLLELAPDVTEEQVRAATGAPLLPAT